MIKTLITKIKDTLDEVNSVQEIKSFPFVGSFSKYPAVVFFPSDINNQYSTNETNLKEYRFNMWIVVSTEVFTVEKAFTDTLPTVMDDIFAKFDSDWDFGTISGHRAWTLMENAIWGQSEEEKGKTAWVEFQLVIRLSNSN